jgi:predicted DNA binding CopG/RHH family protein
MNMPKKTGKSARGGDPLVTVRLPASLIVPIKAWAKREGINRSAAIRSLLEFGLDAVSEKESAERRARLRERRPSA